MPERREIKCPVIRTLIESQSWLEDAPTWRFLEEMQRVVCPVLEVLFEVLPWLEEAAEEVHYGSPMCEDPRDFTPDPECCTEKEIAAWKEACRRAEAGEKVEIPHHIWEKDPDGTVRHISYNPWGIGTSVIRNPELCALRDKVKALIGQLSQGSCERQD
ncbi:MAG: hypothetical protein ACPLSY_01835 [Moorellaceae bacterium]